jgi:hypothetical protein
MERVEIMLGGRRVSCDKDMVKKLLKKEAYVAEIKRLQSLKTEPTFEPRWIDCQIATAAQKLINLNRTIRPCVLTLVNE